MNNLWINGWLDNKIDCWINRHKDEPVEYNVQTESWIYQWMDDGWTEEQMKELSREHIEGTL